MDFLCEIWGLAMNDIDAGVVSIMASPVSWQVAGLMSLPQGSLTGRSRDLAPSWALVPVTCSARPVKSSESHFKLWKALWVVSLEVLVKPWSPATPNTADLPLPPAFAHEGVHRLRRPAGREGGASQSSSPSLPVQTLQCARTARPCRLHLLLMPFMVPKER